jgi:heme o synthase
VRTLIANPVPNLSSPANLAPLDAFPTTAAPEEGRQVHAPAAPTTWKDLVNAYIVLTKPRIISLLLFTTLAAMFIANDAKHPVTLLMFVAVTLGGYMAAGAANTINMVIDRDIDGRMVRTSKRPTVTEYISSRSALLFALTLALGACVLLSAFGCPLAAGLAMAGLAFYVIVYTLILKRRTWQNIVWGGAAGAFPPLVGWAAVTHHLNAFAWLLFAIIFFWTPVHFWALAILLKEDYTKAGIPMLPSVRGERVTVRQIAYYTVATVALTLAPIGLHYAGWLYLIGAMLLNAVLVKYAARLYARPERPQASHLFHYSMLYLALLFLMMAVDHNLLHG